jgi:hypothetical protein
MQLEPEKLLPRNRRSDHVLRVPYGTTQARGPRSLIWTKRLAIDCARGGHATFHLMEQPIDGNCGPGTLPEVTIARIAATSSRRGSEGGGVTRARIEPAAIFEFTTRIVPERLRWRRPPHSDAQRAGPHRANRENEAVGARRTAACCQTNLPGGICIVRTNYHNSNSLSGQRSQVRILSYAPMISDGYSI